MLMRRTRVLLLLAATHSPAERKDFFLFFFVDDEREGFFDDDLGQSEGPVSRYPMAVRQQGRPGLKIREFHQTCALRRICCRKPCPCHWVKGQRSRALG